MSRRPALRCRVTGCDTKIRRGLLMCPQCWRRVPLYERKALKVATAAYVAGTITRCAWFRVIQETLQAALPPELAALAVGGPITLPDGAVVWRADGDSATRPDHQTVEVPRE